MKKVAVTMIFGIILMAGLMSCGAATGGHCDAYGDINDTQNVENNDLAINE
jgi:hypothetical protein